MAALSNLQIDTIELTLTFTIPYKQMAFEAKKENNKHRVTSHWPANLLSRQSYHRHLKQRTTHL